MKQFIERNQVLLGLLTAAVTGVLLVAALTISREDLVSGYELTVEFADAGGLRPGDQVQVAGVRAGRVRALDIVDGHVEAVVEIEGGVELPAATRAEIVLRTLVGKRAIELETGEDFTELLADGDRIPLERTRVATDVPTFGDEAEELLSGIDAEALNTFVAALTDVTRDQREEVAALIESGTDLAEIVTSQEEEIRTLLRNLSRISRTLESRDKQLVAIIDDLDVAAGSLAARREDLTRLLAETQRAGAESADLIRDTRAELDRILDEVHADVALVARHQMDLAEALAYAGDSLYGFGSIAYASGQPVGWGHVFVTALGPVGVDVLAGCGGLLDQQLDLLLGPDPRACEDLENTTFPDDVEAPSGPLAGLPNLPLPGLAAPSDQPVELAPQREGIDLGPRSLLEQLLGGAG